jgi:hypothetical protein
MMDIVYIDKCWNEIQEEEKFWYGILAHFEYWSYYIPQVKESIQIAPNFCETGTLATVTYLDCCKHNFTCLVFQVFFLRL